MKKLFPVFIVSALLLVTACAEKAPEKSISEDEEAASEQTGRQQTEDDIVAVVEGFHAALASADSAAAAATLTPGARILEAGRVETREEYLGGHFWADSRYLSSVDRTLEDRQVRFQGGVAWVSSRTHVQRQGEDALDMNGAELMVLRRGVSSWQIAAIHWSSGRR